jgi:hypothetical protein
MQIKSILSFAFFGLTLALPAQQDVPTISNGLKAIEGLLKTFDDATKALTDSGDLAKATADLTTKAKAVEAAMKKATTDIKASPGDIAVAQALGVQTQASALGTLVKATIDDLIAKKPIIAKANQTGTVKANLASQKAASDDLVAAIVAQLPASIQSIAKTLSAGISKDLERGTQAFA